MDYRNKFLKSLDKKNRYMPLEKEEKQKLDNSYIQKILQNSNSNKMPKTNVFNLSSYNENVPNYKMSIRDMLAADENKQKTLYYVVQRRNEKKNLKKNIIAIKDDRNFINKSNNVYNTNPKFFSKNNTDYSSNRNAINLRHNISRNNEYICNNGKKLTYQYFIDNYSSDKTIENYNSTDELLLATESLWTDIYGESIKEEKPFKIFYDQANDVILVEGSIDRKISLGGVAKILIDNHSKKVLAIWHEK